MSKEGFFIDLLISWRSFYENYKSNSNNARIEKIMKKFNRQRHKFLTPKIIGKKLRKKRYI